MEQLNAVDAAGEGPGVGQAVQAFVGGPDVGDVAEPLGAAGDLALVEAFADEKRLAAGDVFVGGYRADDADALAVDA